MKMLVTEQIASVAAETDLSVPPNFLGPVFNYTLLGGSWFQLPSLTARLRDSLLGFAVPFSFDFVVLQLPFPTAFV